jgi:hypothetical protein
MIARRAREAIAIVLHVHAAQMIVHRAREVSMSVHPVVVVRHSVDQQKVAVVLVREEDVRAKVVVAQQKAAVARAKVVVVRLLAGRQRVVVGRSVMMIVQ